MSVFDVQVGQDGHVQCGYRVKRELYLPIYLIDFTIFYVIPLLLAIVLYGLIARVLYLRNSSSGCKYAPSAEPHRNQRHHAEKELSRNIGGCEDGPPGPAEDAGLLQETGLSLINSLLRLIPPAFLSDEVYETRTDTLQQNRRNVHRRLRVTKMLAVVVILFALLWMPYRTLVLINSFVSTPYLDSWFLLFCRTCIYANSAINPVIYNAMSQKFRSAFRGLYSCQRVEGNQRMLSTAQTCFGTVRDPRPALQNSSQANEKETRAGLEPSSDSTSKLHRSEHQEMAAVNGMTADHRPDGGHQDFRREPGETLQGGGTEIVPFGLLPTTREHSKMALKETPDQAADSNLQRRIRAIMDREEKRHSEFPLKSLRLVLSVSLKVTKRFVAAANLPCLHAHAELISNTPAPLSRSSSGRHQAVAPQLSGSMLFNAAVGFPSRINKVTPNLIKAANMLIAVTQRHKRSSKTTVRRVLQEPGKPPRVSGSFYLPSVQQMFRHRQKQKQLISIAAGMLLIYLLQGANSQQILLHNALRCSPLPALLAVRNQPSKTHKDKYGAECAQCGSNVSLISPYRKSNMLQLKKSKQQNSSTGFKFHMESFECSHKKLQNMRRSQQMSCITPDGAHVLQPQI
ncbi:hypothetical protein CCH79_00013081 [Gambusia affinis]|uniref:Thyrotropin-releasing hormone receptor n=1 Tax=Gambusia affinis TaxID=33528 RepID=A0A315WB64_GAMAF|nr:hypothetical protein CCH79_00013081 [Gambusia affinis]